jgi:hypothetical protein
METKMKEKGKIALPPLWCADICRNSMSQDCIEHCAIKRDASQFELIKDLNIVNMSKFPNPKGMTREESFALIVIYEEKMADHLQQ